MTGRRPSSGRRLLTEETFARFLAALDPDPAHTGARYEELRRMLIVFFEARGFAFGDELADEVVDRVCKRLADGETIRGVPQYCHGVAMRIAQETWRQQRRPIPSLPPPAEDAAEREREDRCLTRCLESLTEDERRLLFRYYNGGGLARIMDRGRMASDLGLSPAGLRTRMHRLREDLQMKMERCLEQPESLKHLAPSGTSK